jgi:glycerol-3-phosphate acyltransferase PlsX
MLVGPGEKLNEMVRDLGGPFDRLKIIPATEVVAMSESPVVAIRKKPDSSLRVAVEMMADGKVEAVISAGNTGAFVAAAMMYARRLRGVRRPAISVVFPTLHGPVVVIDVGANVQCKPAHLLQFGLMASIYAKAVFGVESPRVALLNIGSEDAKGGGAARQTHDLLGQSSLNFIGNVEGRDLFNGTCDVAVCDGFVGNIMLKVVEGMSGAMLEIVAEAAYKESKEFGDRLRPMLRNVARRHDYTEVGGAPLLGIDGICIISHGSSNARAICNAIKAASKYAGSHVNDLIVDSLGGSRKGRK